MHAYIFRFSVGQIEAWQSTTGTEKCTQDDIENRDEIVVLRLLLWSDTVFDEVAIQPVQAVDIKIILYHIIFSKLPISVTPFWSCHGVVWLCLRNNYSMHCSKDQCKMFYGRRG